MISNKIPANSSKNVGKTKLEWEFCQHAIFANTSFLFEPPAIGQSPAIGQAPAIGLFFLPKVRFQGAKGVVTYNMLYFTGIL